MVHDLKISPEWFESVNSGLTSFEVRKDDRPYSPNDVLILREFDGTKYTGRVCKADVRFVLRGEHCREEHCIVAIKVKGYAAAQKNLNDLSSSQSNARSCTTCDYAEEGSEPRYCCRWESPTYGKNDWCYSYRPKPEIKGGEK